MNPPSWEKTLDLFEQNLQRILLMPRLDPSPSAKFCRESAHRTVGHLTACQAAWIPLMRQLRSGETHGVVPVNPDPLFRKLGFSTAEWEVLFNQFQSDRNEWRQLLESVDLDREIRTTKRVYTGQSLTKRMVDHEKRHLDDLL